MSHGIIIKDDVWQKLAKDLAQLSGDAVDVGFWGESDSSTYGGEESVASIAALNEFDAVFPTYTRVGRHSMRKSAYRLRPKGSSPIRRDIEILMQRYILIGGVARSRTMISKRVGKTLKRGMTKELSSGNFRRNKKRTTDAKGFNHPMVHTGELVGSLKTRVGTVVDSL